MLERQMEELIARFPEDFFPNRGFVLMGRQVSFPGVGRFDLLFSDHHNRRHLMELKAQALKIADADQVGRYKTALQERGERRIVLWLVSPRIPTHVRESLDDLGIEYEEIHVARFKHVAEEHGIPIREELFETAEVLLATDKKNTPERTNTLHAGVLDTPRRLTIPEAMDKVGSLLQQQYGDRIPRRAIVNEVRKLGPWPENSIFPSDFCYNRENPGSRPLKYRVFLMDDPEGNSGLYKYVGRNFSYSGPVIRKSRKT